MAHRIFRYGSSIMILAWFPLIGMASEHPPIYEKSSSSSMSSEFSAYTRVQVRHFLTKETKEVLASNMLEQNRSVEVEAGGCFRRKKKVAFQKEFVKSTPTAGGYFATWVSRGSNTAFGMSLGGEYGNEITRIIAGSPMEQRGFSVGDQLIAIDGLWTGAMTLDNIYAYLRNIQSDRITLLVHRGTPVAPLFSPIISTEYEIK